MAKIKKHKNRCTANGVPYAAKLARQRMIREAVQQEAHNAAVHVEADIRTQRALWLAVASIADAYGIGPDRMRRFFEALQANNEEFERMKAENDEDYANEKLRMKAERCTGMEIDYLYEAEWKAAVEKHECEGIELEEYV